MLSLSNNRTVMQIIRESFKDFNVFKEAIDDWSLDYNILSKSDFIAEISLFTSENFSLSRERLNGKIEHRGLTPIGYRTIVIPINYENEFIWYNKKVSGKDLLIFPKNNIVDVITYNGLDVYLISIKEEILYNIIDKLQYKNCYDVFDGDSKELFLSKEFARKFHKISTFFLNTDISELRLHSILSEKIIYQLLKYIEDSISDNKTKEYKTSELALQRAVEIINSNGDNLNSISEICSQIGISERALLTAFKSKYHVSTSQYIKAVRLNRVKEELYLSNSTDINISTLAGKYHFWHMGQFAIDFRKQFGLLPSEILNKR